MARARRCRPGTDSSPVAATGKTAEQNVGTKPCRRSHSWGGTCCPSPSRASGGNACCYKQSPSCRLMVSDSNRWLGGLSGSGYQRRAERTALLRVKMAAKADRESWMSFEYLSSTSALRHVIIHKVTPFSPGSLNTMSIATTERRRASKR